MERDEKSGDSTAQKVSKSDGSPLRFVGDDEKQLADRYADYLRDRYRVTTADTGRNALTRLTEAASIVLLDRNIPDLPGEQILAEIRRREYGCRVATVTSVKPDFDSLALGFDEYVIKPALKQELPDTGNVLLARSKDDSTLNEYYSLRSKQASLAEEQSEAALSGSETYHQMADRITVIRSDLTQISSEFDNEDVIVSFRNISPEPTPDGERA